MPRSRCSGPARWRWTCRCDSYVADYRRKRDLIYGGLADLYEVVKPGGAFYIFPKAPRGTGSEFVAKAIENNC